MLDDNNFTYDDTMSFNKFECYPDITESYQRQREPFTPNTGGNFPPIGSFPPNSISPGSDVYPPNFNYPGGTFNPPGVPKSPPPNYVPHKGDAGVQKMGYSEGGIQPYAVSANSIRFCLYKFTYIWETSGRNYWAYLLNVDRRTVSGFRWFRRSWVYFGIDLRRIDSFVCYRSCENECEDCVKIEANDIILQNNNIEYTTNGTRDVYTKTLASIDIPEIKEDFITQTVGYVDDTKINSEMPCVKARNICYRITLEVSYPSTYDADLKNRINNLAEETSNDVFKFRNNDSTSSPLETFNSSLASIPETISIFSNPFNSKLKLLDSFISNSSDITYSIRSEKIYNNWKPYFYNDSLY
ncbi:hypothetical protein [Clostridium sp.]|uniref:hypothetical protein n=1 Tax=Clostridium sp. TaxID=1506 RepID=UPI0026315EED|nr:hypothetical protein [Clostridium sp.]